MKSAVYKVEKLVNGGMGLIREGERTVFVPYVIPGEEIAVRMERGASKTARAVPVKIISPSSQRRNPPCPLFGRCGGCSFQHIAYKAQLKIKRDILAETLFWIAKIKIEPAAMIPSPKHYAYRSRIRMHVRGGEAGFFAAEKKNFLPVKYCHIAREEINGVLRSLGGLIEKERPGEIELIMEDKHLIAALGKKGEQAIYRTIIDSEKTADWRKYSRWKNTFSQTNPGQNENLRNLVGALVSEIKPESVLELYAGSGNLTEKILPHSGRVAAVDSDEEAVKAGVKNLGKSPNLEMHNVEAAEFLNTAADQNMKPDLLLLDPPRTGAKETVPGIIALSPRNIVYVSCDPATLARDVKVLMEGGYGISSVTPLDMFPQTAHIESVTVLSLAG